MKVSKIASISVFALIAANAGAQCTTHVAVEGRDELLNYSTSDIIDTIPTPVSTLASTVAAVDDFVTAVHQGCATFNWWLFNAGGPGVNINWNTPEAITRDGIKQAHAVLTDGLTWNDVQKSFIPSIKPCEPPVLWWRFAGNMDAYTFHIGTSPYPRKIRKVTFSGCDNIVVEVKQLSTIEIPWSIAGGLIAAESFGDPEVTDFVASLSVSGTLFGQALSESISIDSDDGFGETKEINKSAVASVTLPPGRHEFTLNFSGHGELTSTAKSAGLFGFLSGSANGSVDFPSTITLGLPRGGGNTALPANVRISTAANDGTLVYADTFPHPEVSGLVTFEGWTGPQKQRVLVDFQPFGETYRTYGHNARVTSGNQLLALAPDAGKFFMFVGSPPYLRKKVLFDASSGSNVGVGTINLIAGDLTGDNYVGTDDYLVLNDTFDLSTGDPNFAAVAEMTGDGYVGTDDYLLLSQNFDTFGDN